MVFKDKFFTSGRNYPFKVKKLPDCPAMQRFPNNSYLRKLICEFINSTNVLIRLESRDW
ncbi:MAG: hypothetical protein H8D42_03905 [Candidatus Marinimicrobia bacterium]|nr:hypothetical protein [Candidatus Neomarinimicrobiota bacterium]